MGDDIAALIEHLGLDKPDLVGYSLGGGVAFQTAVNHPELVRKLVIVSANVKRSAIYPDMLAQQGQVERRGGGQPEGHADVRVVHAARAAARGLPAAAGQDGRVDGPGLRLQRRGPRAPGPDDVRGRRRRHVPAQPRGRGVRAARRRPARRRLDGRGPAEGRPRARDPARRPALQHPRPRRCSRRRCSRSSTPRRADRRHAPRSRDPRRQPRGHRADPLARRVA